MRIFIFMAAASVLLASSPVAADSTDFCTDLQTITAQATSGFVSLRAAMLTSQAATADDDHPLTTYAATTSLAGATRCEADDMANNGKSRLFFTCYFAANPTKLATLQTVANAIVDCIGIDQSDDMDEDDSDDTGEAHISRANFRITVLAADSYNDTHVIISGNY